jgi:hypothetical protein
MRLNDAFPSKYLKADHDVPEEGQLVVTIRRVEIETLGQGKDAEDKPVVYFDETEKPLVLNRINFATIAKVLNSDDTDDWTGRRIALYSADVTFGKDQMRGIRVRSKAPAPAPAKQPAPRVAAGTAARTAPVNTDADPVDDEDVPFACPVFPTVQEWEESPFRRNQEW